jgi:acetyltransferase-like isoleucine patch superfamily enzyme
MSLKRGVYLLAIAILHGLLAWLPFNFLRVFVLRAAGMEIGRGTHIARRLKLDFPWRIAIGSNCWVSAGVYLDGRGGSVRIGDSVDLSAEAAIYTLSHNIYDASFSPKGGDVVIQDRVWVGTRAVVLPGARLSEGCVIGALSLVRGETDRFGLYVGNPATRVKLLPETRASSVRRS